MMIKFLAHGTGSAAKAADYLTRERFPAQDQEQDQDQEKEPGRSESFARQSGPSGRRGRLAGVRAQVHLGRDRLVAGGCPERRENRPGWWTSSRRPPWAGLEPDRYAWAAIGAPRSGQWGPVCSPSLAAATVYVELRGTMRNTKTRDRTRDVPSQEGHLDWSRPALIISHVFAILFSRQGGAKWC